MVTEPFDIAEQLCRKIELKAAQVGIIGLGYVGLPLALTFVEAGFQVTGFDTDPKKVEALTHGRSYIRHIEPPRIAQSVADGRFRATAEFDALEVQDAILICVPTPLTKQREPDMRFVQTTSETIARHLRRGQLIVLESTTYPGTTDELVRSSLEARGLRLGRDFMLAFSPEREDPGNLAFNTKNIPKLVGGVDQVSGRVAERLYGAALSNVVRVVDARTAEAAKLTENIFRGVNIALVNELKIVFDRMGIDVWKVLDAAETKPFGFMRFDPGPGWGGHCIPIDPFYMAWKAREFDVTTKFIELAGEINIRMPEFVIGKLQGALNQLGKPMNGSRVLLLGVAYKADIDDCRESPAFPIIEKLAELGAEVSFHDPYVKHLPRTRAWPNLENKPSVSLDRATVEAADAVLVVTAHKAVDYELVARHAKLITDTRRIFLDASNVIRA
ncbi:MAG: UDP-N-acetyl-D-glucosamine dehydrogenase [Myxococcaceae bacterium]|nr:UDP-N-acetyl-D-glucosamine dehydrogenase [Myxococcaceae bacterium]